MTFINNMESQSNQLLKIKSKSNQEPEEDIWIMRNNLNDSNSNKSDNEYVKNLSSINRKPSKAVHYAPFLYEEINNNRKQSCKTKQQEYNNLHSILRINNSNNLSDFDLNSESVWVKQTDLSTSSLVSDSKEFDNFLSKKSFYLEETYGNLFDLKKDENYIKMKKIKQQQQINNLLNQVQDKSSIRSSSLVVNTKTKLNKKVDFLDIKLNNCLHKKKLVEDHSLPSSSQSSPKSTLSHQNTNEDSFVESNLSSSSSDVIQSTKNSNQKITALSSLSSTSSGVGSSNVSSASSTTSETPSTENMPNVKTKVAPKAVISDDGDIEIETPNKSSKLNRTVDSHNRASMRIIDQNVYKNDQKKYNNVYYVNAKNSALTNRYSQQIQKPNNYNSQQHYYYQNHIHQNQLAAAAAAAAAMDKEKQRDALIEYVKSQQLQEHLNHKYNKNEIPNDSFKNKPNGLEISKNERLSNGKKVMMNNINYTPAVIKTPARRDSCLGLCFLMYGPETKRTLLPSQVTGIDTVKALFVRAFADKLTMSYLDDEKSVKIYIKDQVKDLFYQLDDMNDIKDKCVLKLVEISKPTNTTPPQASPVQHQNMSLQNSPQTFYSYESSPTNNPMTQSQYCYSSLSEHQSIPAPYETKNPETVSLNHRSLSEPRSQVKKSNQQKQFQNPIYNQQPQEYFLTNQDLQSLNSTVETYDNLDAQSSTHHSRIESKFTTPPPPTQPFNYYDRYNRSMNPIYNSMRVNSRDVKSADRDVLYSYKTAPQTHRKIPPEPLSRQSTLNDSTFSDSPTKGKIMCDIDATEDDTISLPSSISVRGFKILHSSDMNKNLDSTDYDLEVEDDEKTVNEQNETENYEDPKIKMMLMQKQLETLTNLVHQALINKDLNKLEGIAQTAKLNQNRFMRTNVNNSKASLSLINDQAKQLKNDFVTIKKMHENFNSIIGDTMKDFVRQINDKLKIFYSNEESESFKLESLINKYNTDFSKIENELCDLETVVDDLRENILKHKFKVSIDDVECYALALSQLSKQLVNLKTSFSSIKEHYKQNSSTNAENRLAILPRSSSNKKTHNPPGLPPVPKQKPSNSQENGLNLIHKEFMNDIQSLKPDHEQRKLAIEVDDAFNQLMSEISMIAHDINPNNKLYKNCLTIESYNVDSENDSLETDSLKSKHDTESEATMKKRSKFRAQKNQLKEEREYSVNSSSSSNSSFGSTPSSPTYSNNSSSPLPIISTHMNGINIQTMPIPLAVAAQFHQNKSFLETVHEEEPSGHVDVEPKSEESQEVFDDEMLNSVENHLYEQLSQLRPVKPKNYKTSTSICLVNSETGNGENTNVTSMVITPNNQINEDASNQTSSSTAFVNLSKNTKLNVRFNDGQVKSTKIMTNGSMQRVGKLKNESQNSNEDNSSSSSNSESKQSTDQTSSSNIELNSNGKRTSCVIVPRRNSDKNNIMNSSVTLSSSTASSSSSLCTPRRVSLSVTDL